jgi:hypothetical protein
MKNFTLIVFLLTAACAQVSAQEAQLYVVNASGGAYTGDNYSYEWSIGELVLVNEMMTDDGKYIFTNGFLQPVSKNGKPIYTPASFRNHEFRLLNNPVRASESLSVMLSTDKRGKLRLKVFDEKGYVQYYNEINVNSDVITQNIDLYNCAAGTYFLKAEFTSSDRSSKYKEGTYKFVKIH